MRNFYLFSIVFFFLISCRKHDAPCGDLNINAIDFKILEQVGDTLLPTDTVFMNRATYFKTNQTYPQISWKIGEDQRTFTEPLVQLNFNTPNQLGVSLSALNSGKCFEKIDTTRKTLTVVEDNGTIVSPLVGTYLGNNQGNLADTFSVKIRFWFGSRYSWWSTGAYSIENLPNGYKDGYHNWNGNIRPEITGIISATGYKNLVIDRSGYEPAQGIKGYCSFKNEYRDTLVINYTLLDTALLHSTGKVKLIPKIFIGIRKS